MLKLKKREIENEKIVFEPADMFEKTDEENLGFTYAELDVYIRTGKIADENKKDEARRLEALGHFIRNSTRTTMNIKKWWGTFSVGAPICSVFPVV